jgi:hypothetical protein
MKQGVQQETGAIVVSEALKSASDPIAQNLGML